MNRFLLYAIVASAGVATTVLIDPPVNLQASSPGTQQVGHVNVSGKVLAGSLQATDPGSSAQVVKGDATASGGATYGGLFRVWSSTGTGVRGVALSTLGSADGGTFQTAASEGAGVRGFATSVTGVNYGVFGKAVSSTGFAGYFQGNLHSTGTISGDGSGITTLNASMLASGTVSNSRLPVPISLSGNLGSAVVYATNASASGIGVFGGSTSATGSTIGTQGHVLSSAGTGVLGWAHSGSGTTMGGRFVSLSTSGKGVVGHTTATTGTTYGLYGESNSTTGRAVFGFASATTGSNFGGLFHTASPSGRGVYGTASATTGFPIGVMGHSAAKEGRGVYGYVNNTEGGLCYGVYGEGPYAGVYGRNDSPSGVAYGVLGKASSSAGYGVFATGNLGGSGVKTFRIDHPLDPENKFLLHYSAEGPEPQNIYNGTVVTDHRGRAWVQLPDYFGEVNTAPRYQLTVLEDEDSTAFVQVKVGRKIRDNRFLVVTSAPNVEVSWEVKARRNDRWVRLHGAPVERDKEGPEAGRYQNPELYGKPKSMGIWTDARGDKVSAPTK